MNKAPLIKVTAALGFCLALSASAVAETVLRVATWLPPGHAMNAEMWPTWGKWIEEATEGRVKIKLEYGMGHPKSMFDLVEDGVVDASFSYHGYVPGRFKLPQIAEQPGLGVNAEAASVALWRVQQKYFNKAEEFEGLTLAAIFTHGPGYVHTIKPISTLADLKGKKIRIGGGIQSDLGKRLAITPIAAPGSKVYEMLQQGVIDGVFMPMGEQQSLRLYEVAPNVLAVPGGMYLGSFSIFINPDFLADLPKKDRDAIMSVSGEKLSAMAGSAWDNADAKGLTFAKNNGVTVTSNKQLAQEFKQISKGLDDEWVESVKSKGVDADAALKELRKIARNQAK
ncbi:C4-dicarboxylate ABC transporter substrate-binding protein [Colwellia psychrerythraea]|uniref:C4-dicarboxylate ABC transporter substrate-binding protein n=1 Tax=Colwellia psychrerythraea TaxID=28229 RepID=A0A1Y5EM91_COLPS|nr:C4-dicarboxylate ABC transporter substrate-binding protein [Colwellia psychrerythraea]